MICALNVAGLNICAPTGWTEHRCTECGWTEHRCTECGWLNMGAD